MSTDKNIRIEKVIVKKLFGTYDYVLDFDNPVSIIIAPNGLGKTTIFRLIKATMSADENELYFLKDIPFEEFRIKLSDDSILSLRKGDKTKDKEEYPKRIEKKFQSPFVIEYLNDAIDFGINYRITVYTSYDIEKEQSTEKWNTYVVDYLDVFLSRIRRTMIKKAFFTEGFTAALNEHKELLIKTGCYYPVNFIPADRLSPVGKKDPKKGNSPENESVDSRIGEATRHLRGLVNFMVKAYSMDIARAQSELPFKYLRPEDTRYPEFPEFKEKWDKYVFELEKFSDLGFINDKAKIGEISKEDYSKRKEFLNIYLNLFSKTTKHLKRDYEKFTLFKKIFDERNELTGKTIKFTPDGIKAQFDDGRDPIAMDCLSSGEKNDFIMFYDLLFDTYPDSIVMIDEPEISLHIAWQDTFVEHLLSIAEENGFQVLMATHSPHIVSGYFDLVKEL